ncbi:MAG: hypothetical protein IKS90_00020 [Clostridia bacterium]|nr:hypothetical protein [Clostridia bacterium]
MDFFGIIMVACVVGGIVSLFGGYYKNGRNAARGSDVNNPQIQRFSMKELIGDIKDTAARSAEHNARIKSMTVNEQLEELRRLREARLGINKEAPSKREPAMRERYTEERGKPIYDPVYDDCAGGSIHDGYHEGTVRRPAPASSAEGKAGSQGVAMGGAAAAARQRAQAMKTDTSANVNAGAEIAASHAKTELGADRLKAAIADKPAIVQGLIWSEVLSKPHSDG